MFIWKVGLALIPKRFFELLSTFKLSKKSSFCILSWLISFKIWSHKSHLWFVRWNLIYPKSTPSKARFFLYLRYRKLFLLLKPYFQHLLQHAPFLFLWIIFYLILVIHLTSVFITLFAKCFSAVFKNINLNMLFANKHIPAKQVEMFIWEKNVPPKRDPGFMKAGSLIGGRIYFRVNRFWIFNRIILQGEISFKWGPHLAVIFFPHVTKNAFENVHH